MFEAVTSTRNRRLLLNILRVVVSGGLLVWVFATIEIDELLNLVRDAEIGLLALAYVLAVIGLLLRALRWQLLLNAVGVSVQFGRIVYLYFVGQFFSTFLPTGFAGDAVKVLEIGEKVDRAEATGTVIVDRLSGFVSLFLIGAIALPFAGSLVPQKLAALIGILAMGVLGGSILLFEGRLLAWITSPLPNALSLSGDGFLGHTYSAIVACGGRAVLRAVALSTLFNLEWMTAIYILAQALHISVSFGHVVLFTPLAVTALLFPFAVSGLGVREGLYVTLYTQPGVDLTSTAATGLGLATFTLDLCNSLIGGVLYLMAGARGIREKQNDKLE